ncbi:hypothetical protein H310_08668 [Aphanomyces invadans]|uniref:Uncharacterized protein n=1 Tax=Aphanomyces invadans TaxID=157072 RepID=A0A024TX39_9STRA|nr:hypothetical protein H310_08668 [Aphanomyces invadans]ETV98544.1 hypothetical protein H310_08668 [Aphanomyces invadans]|eukprot:XP_008872741.1 hypothetical protein H310_08668 [Aphanomyces invadans]
MSATFAGLVTFWAHLEGDMIAPDRLLEGADKSSMVHAYCRIDTLAEGRIMMDGIDIATLGLWHLRTH